jgi:DNA invertase Pin-like site-specific DNA recombinase
MQLARSSGARIMAAPITVWSYAAVSSSPQEATLEDQQQWASETAARNGWVIAREFFGVASGAKGTREILSVLIDELERTPKASRPQRVLMVRIDRVGRMALDCIAAVASLRKLGVLPHTRQDGDVKLETAVDSLRPIFELVTAEMENAARSDKWKAFHARRRAEGKHVGTVPYGVILIDGKAVPFEAEAQIVREIFGRAEQRWGYTRLARWAREHAPPKRTHDGSDKPYRWAVSTIKSILVSKTLRNLVVSEDQWQRTKGARQSDFRARAPKRWNWPLQGTVRSTCGKLLSGHCSGESRYRTRYYVCRHHTLEPGAKSHPGHRADHLEADFVRLLRSLHADPTLVDPLPDDEPADIWEMIDLDAERRIADAEKRIQRAWKLAEEAQLDPSQLRARLAALEAQRRNAEEARNAARAARARDVEYQHTACSFAKLLEELPDLWRQTTVELQQELARAFDALLAETPQFGGLFADPSCRGRLVLRPVAKQRKTDALRTIATRAALVSAARRARVGIR